MKDTGWQFWVDRGGTFTDVVGRRPDGRLVARKVLSETALTRDGRHGGDPGVAAIRGLLGCPPGTPMPAAAVTEVRMGTTVATNALLQRRGRRTALVITAGFTDALRIGYQNRPRIFDRRIALPEQLPERVIAYQERIDAGGTVLQEPDLDALRAELAAARAEGVQAVAIACLHAHLFPGHEQAAAAIAREVGFTEVACSAEVNPLTRIVPRAGTTVADAYLSGVLRDYTDRVAAELAGVQVRFAASNGGLVGADHFRGKDAVLSGPAGGIVGMARTAAAAGFDRVIGLDMGGTSTDVSHYAGSYDRVNETEIAGVRLRAPMLDIHTVAAGGGSLLRVVDGRYQVGPESAGANPGPTAYRRGGPLTLTDANVLLGRVPVEHFPAVFGPGGDERLDADAVRAAFAELATSTGGARSVEEMAAGFVTVAVANMANAVKRVSVARGRDVTRYALVGFGGAGGQHACAVADALGIDTVLVPPLAGLLSAVGIGLAELTAIRSQAVERRLDENGAGPLSGSLLGVAEDLSGAVLDELTAQGAPPEEVSVTVSVNLRYEGTDTALAVPLGGPAAMTAAFGVAHEQAYSFRMDRPLVIESVTAEAVAPTGTAAVAAPTAGRPEPAGRTRMYVEGRWQEATLLGRDALAPGAEPVPGPAVVIEDGATTVIEPGWAAAAGPAGHLLVRRVTERQAAATGAAAGRGDEVDPVRLEIFANAFMSIAEQMGARLQATAQSVNIKERLDFSCAVFDAEGHLVANAPHMPVHLGSMGASVAAVVEAHRGRMQAGDAYAVNDPYRGGTHLPDVTVVSPVFAAALGLPAAPDEPAAGTDAPLFFVASRGHHAEIGGIAPGSMPAFSREIDEEGVRFDGHLLVRAGELREAATRDLLTGGRHPSRAPETNLADLRAQLAANATGIRALAALCAEAGPAEPGAAVVAAYMRHVQDNAEEAVRRVVDALDDGAYRYEMDSGAVIAVRVEVDRAARAATIDFTGTSAQLATNFNAPSSVVLAAVLYVFRTLVEEDIPLNDGCLRPLRLVIPPASMLSPEPPAAVVAGNVETSQAVTGALYAALGVAAEGSGTMNNVTFGNAAHQYYETVGSGSGAGPGYDGTAVVQTHMTNSRLTDPEVLEARFPVLVEEFAIRAGSGGAGEYRGGDGALRRLRFTEPVTVSVLGGHRRVPPYGMAGGSPGALGSNHLERADGTLVPMAGADQVEAAAGDVLVIATPGGGGYGLCR